MVGGNDTREKKALYKSVLREIFQSKARFLSILLIIFLGVCFYAGIKATGPDMMNTADHYYKKQKLMQTEITSPLGFESEDIHLLSQDKRVAQVEGSYLLDVNQKEANQVIRLMSYSLHNKDQLNQPVIVSGRLPENDGEVVADNRAFETEKLKLGDTLKIEDNAVKNQLHQSTFKVVGFVNSPLYVDRVSRGSTIVGKGSVDYFILLPEENFKNNLYTHLYVTYKDLNQLPSYSDKYNKKYEQDQKSIEYLLKDRSDKRKTAKINETTKKINNGETQIATGYERLEIAQKQLNQESENLSTKKSQLKQAKASGLSETSVQEDEIRKAEKQLADQKTKLKETETDLIQGKKNLVNQRNDAKQLDKVDYRYVGREDNVAYSEYKDNANRISSIATVFPVFFFMIAALICLTTMTRMVDEKRGEIGTLKALGYTNWEIAQKYVVYASAASLIGSLLGLIAGYHVFPLVIYNAYGSLYNLPPVIITYYSSYAIQSIFVALLCTLISALVVLRVDLLSTPAQLMRPKAPKPGKRILLERISWLWRKFNFNQKVTARNLFRYKQRMLMTILGIAGCMAMIITGFGIKDSIGDIVGIQFSKIWHYDATVVYNGDASQDETTSYEKVRDKLPYYEQNLLLSQKTIEVKKPSFKKHEVTLDTPKNVSHLSQFITFKDRVSGEKYQLTDNGVIINEKLADLFDIQAGDSIEIDVGEGELYKVKVDHIVENYALHFIYMTPTYYEKVFDKKPVYNVDLLKFKQPLTKKQENNFAEKLMDEKNVVNVSYTSQIGEAMSDTMGSLTIVVWVLIISAALLAFIVLYNLTNINISERIRSYQR
ncbi:FtsX-like permease family protein [Vagococcus vulneris]|uniref:FtsX-like permease family protein n=1 Tax=Vagococcus vulneris TaxID=1977869 RepID=UPI001F0C14CE|nr:FtsX-like permease family protein [Vagococcus vulneris]